MSGHLILVSIGPVQEFIAQARRMRDLWFGSHVLSEVSKAAARAMAEHGATLVFPALDRGDVRLEPCDELYHEDGTPAYNVANKLVAIIPDDGDPRAVAEDAEKQAQKRLLDWGLTVLEKRDTLVDRAAHACAREQLETLLRVHAVWMRRGESYEKALVALEEELYARKSLYTFAQWTEQRGGVHKSSLDGGRETVLRQQGRDGKEWGRYRIGEREQLDAVGLLKRTGGEPGQFVPVPTVGLAAWLETAERERPDELKALVDACDKRRIPRVWRQKAGAEVFPFDGQILFAERWVPYLSEHSMSPGEAAEFGRLHVQPLLAGMPEPYPYIACLVADGDRMGDTISALAKNGPEHHWDFSKKLAEFAREARAIVEKQHRGILVYAGGDDVLGFVCVQNAPACARALYDAFGKIAGEATEAAGVARPTLSVGLGIGHVMQSLGRLLWLGRHAEQVAKRKRNTLAVIHERHAGTIRTWHGSWDTGADELERAVGLLEDERLSATKIYQIQALLAQAPAAGDAGGDAERWSALLGAEARRILARTGLGEGEDEPPDAGEVGLSPDGSYAEVREQIGRWVEGMQIAVELRRARASVREVKA